MKKKNSNTKSSTQICEEDMTTDDIEREDEQQEAEEKNLWLLTFSDGRNVIGHGKGSGEWFELEYPLSIHTNIDPKTGKRTTDFNLVNPYTTDTQYVFAASMIAYVSFPRYEIAMAYAAVVSDIYNAEIGMEQAAIEADEESDGKPELKVDKKSERIGDFSVASVDFGGMLPN